MNSLISAVICNGYGSRLKRDKGLIKKNNQTWAEIIFHKLKHVTENVYVSINPTQYEDYKIVFPPNTIVQDATGLKGPLAALFTIHKLMPEKDIFILACDMLNMDVGTIKKMVAVYRSNKHLYDYFVYKKQVNIEPMAGIYTKRGLIHMYNAFFSGNIPGANVRYILASGNTYAIKIRDRDRFTASEAPENPE